MLQSINCALSMRFVAMPCESRELRLQARVSRLDLVENIPSGTIACHTIRDQIAFDRVLEMNRSQHGALVTPEPCH
jgi:hypothetical protein